MQKVGEANAAIYGIYNRGEIARIVTSDSPEAIKNLAKINKDAFVSLKLNGLSILRVACEFKKINAVRELIALGCEVGEKEIESAQKDPDTWSCLRDCYILSLISKREVAKLETFVKTHHDVDINETSKKGISYVDAAIRLDKLDSLQKLFELGATIDDSHLAKAQEKDPRSAVTQYIQSLVDGSETDRSESFFSMKSTDSDKSVQIAKVEKEAQKPSYDKPHFEANPLERKKGLGGLLGKKKQQTYRMVITPDLVEEGVSIERKAYVEGTLKAESGVMYAGLRKLSQKELCFVICNADRVEFAEELLPQLQDTHGKTSKVIKSVIAQFRPQFKNQLNAGSD